VATDAAGREPFNLDEFLPYRLTRIAAAISRQVAHAYQRDFGLSIPEWRVLANLSREEGVSTRELARSTFQDKAKVSRATTRLANAGLIERRPHREDGRLVAFVLTDQGRRLFEQVRAQAEQHMERVQQALPPEIRDQVGPVLRSLEDALNVFDGIAELDGEDEG